MNYTIFSQESPLVSTFLASFLIWLLFLGLAVLWIYDGKKWKEIALHAFIASIVAWVLSQIVKDIMPALRPFKINGYPPLTLITPGDSSFPSVHAALAFAIATSIWFHDKKVGAIYIISASFIALGRVLTNVHYPVDVIAGAIVGSGSAILVDKLHPNKLIKYRKKRKGRG